MITSLLFSGRQMLAYPVTDLITRGFVLPRAGSQVVQKSSLKKIKSSINYGTIRMNLWKYMTIRRQPTNRSFKLLQEDVRRKIRLTLS